MIETLCGQNVDWTATGSMLSGLGTIGGAIVVFFAAKIGKDTFTDWKRQKIEERRIDLAEAALTLAYKLQGAIGSIRGPFAFAGEVAAAEANLREQSLLTDQTPEAQKGSLSQAQTTLNRITRFGDLYDTLAELRPSTRAVFGAEVEGTLAVFDDVTRRVRAAALGYARTGREPYANEVLARRDLERRERYEQILWEDSEVDDNGELVEDKIKKAVADAVERLENLFRPYLQGQAA